MSVYPSFVLDHFFLTLNQLINYCDKTKTKILYFNYQYSVFPKFWNQMSNDYNMKIEKITSRSRGKRQDTHFHAAATTTQDEANFTIYLYNGLHCLIYNLCSVEGINWHKIVLTWSFIPSGKWKPNPKTVS